MGGPNFSKAFSTMVMARSTPAQKPLGLANITSSEFPGLIAFWASICWSIAGIGNSLSLTLYEGNFFRDQLPFRIYFDCGFLA